MQRPEQTDPLGGLARHGLWQMGAIILPGLYTVLLVAYLLQSLGPEAYAPWAMAGAVVGWLALLDAGLSLTTAREAARAVAGDAEGVARVLTTNGAYAFLGSAAAISGALIAFVIPVILRLGGAEATEAWLVGALLTLDLGIVIATAGWAGTVRGMRRFDLLLVVNAVQVAVAGACVVLLLPQFGLVGAAVAQPAGRIAARLVLALLLRRHLAWFQARPHWPGWSQLKVVGAFSLPIMAWHIAREIGIGTDLVVVGAATSATDVGLFAAGSQFVRYVGLFIFPAIAVLLPSFAAAAFTQPDVLPLTLQRAMFLAGLIGASIYGGIALQAGTVVQVWSGQSSELSVQVMTLYAITWALLTPPYVVALMLIARGRHALFGKIVLVESLVNVGLSIVLVQILGAIGVAIGTFVVMSIDWLIVIPAVSARLLEVSVWRLLAAMALGLAAGAAMILVINMVPIGGVPGLLVRAALGGVALAACLAIGVPATRNLATMRSGRTT